MKYLKNKLTLVSMVLALSMAFVVTGCNWSWGRRDNNNDRFSYRLDHLQEEIVEELDLNDEMIIELNNLIQNARENATVGTASRATAFSNIRAEMLKSNTDINVIANNFKEMYRTTQSNTEAFNNLVDGVVAFYKKLDQNQQAELINVVDDKWLKRMDKRRKNGSGMSERGTERIQEKLVDELKLNEAQTATLSELVSTFVDTRQSTMASHQTMQSILKEKLSQPDVDIDAVASEIKETRAQLMSSNAAMDNVIDMSVEFYNELDATQQAIFIDKLGSFAKRDGFNGRRGRGHDDDDHRRGRGHDDDDHRRGHDDDDDDDDGYSRGRGHDDDHRRNQSQSDKRGGGTRSGVNNAPNPDSSGKSGQKLA